MKRGFLSIFIAATIFIPFALSGCGSKVDDSSAEEIHRGHDHDHHGHDH